MYNSTRHYAQLTLLKLILIYKIYLTEIFITFFSKTIEQFFNTKKISADHIILLYYLFCICYLNLIFFYQIYFFLWIKFFTNPFLFIVYFTWINISYDIWKLQKYFWYHLFSLYFNKIVFIGLKKKEKKLISFYVWKGMINGRINHKSFLPFYLWDESLRMCSFFCLFVILFSTLIKIM